MRPGKQQSASNGPNGILMRSSLSNFASAMVCTLTETQAQAEWRCEMDGVGSGILSAVSLRPKSPAFATHGVLSTMADVVRGGDDVEARKGSMIEGPGSLLLHSSCRYFCELVPTQGAFLHGTASQKELDRRMTTVQVSLPEGLMRMPMTIRLTSERLRRRRR